MKKIYKPTVNISVSSSFSQHQSDACSKCTACNETIFSNRYKMGITTFLDDKFIKEMYTDVQLCQSCFDLMEINR